MLAAIVLAVSPALGGMDEKSRDAVETVARVRAADYAGDRKELKRLYVELASYAANEKIASRVAYWRGFALWRRALNGFNEAVDSKELGQDLDQAVAEFNKALTNDPDFADAKIGKCSCLYNLMFLNVTSQARIRELLKQAAPLMKELQLTASDNPRYLWVVGANQFYMAKGDAEAQKKAEQTYQRGLKMARDKTNQTADTLEPCWGEPELMINLAWLHLHSKVPDPNKAEEYARAALKLVPSWHFVRDILLPQILKAKAKGQ
jgi:hypothetical protein